MSLIIKWKTPKPGDSTGFLLWRLHNVWQQRLKAVLKPFSLTHVQYVMLAGVDWLEQNSPGVSQARLAEFVGADVMMTSTVVRALAERGLLQRKDDPSDSRAKCLELSADGRELLEEAMSRVQGFEGGFFAALGEGLPGFQSMLDELLTVDEGVRAGA